MTDLGNGRTPPKVGSFGRGSFNTVIGGGTGLMEGNGAGKKQTQSRGDRRSVCVVAAIIGRTGRA